MQKKTCYLNNINIWGELIFAKKNVIKLVLALNFASLFDSFVPSLNGNFYTREQKKTHPKNPRCGYFVVSFKHFVRSIYINFASLECLQGRNHSQCCTCSHWMVVTEDGHMVTGRQEPHLVLVSLTCEGGDVILNGPDMAELRFPVKQPNNTLMDCRCVFGAGIPGRDCGDEASRWLVRYLKAKKTYRLVQFEPHMRARRPADSESAYFPNDKVAYPDSGPVMLLSEASIKDLSDKMNKDLTAERFRPNIVIGDCEAFAEVRRVSVCLGIGKSRHVLRRRRTNFTHDSTGIIYRMCKPEEKHIYKSAPLFGQLLSVEKPGVIQVGDPVYQVSR
uniref:MOSC domain-containing protein n=1 Tax=Hippocampus comes TaxID=109280 RepID=A0A3Q3DM60_HIPCM